MPVARNVDRDVRATGACGVERCQCCRQSGDLEQAGGPHPGRRAHCGDDVLRTASRDGYSGRCSNTCPTHRSLTFGPIFFGMVRILPTHKDAASNLGASQSVDEDGSLLAADQGRRGRRPNARRAASPPRARSAWPGRPAVKRSIHPPSRERRRPGWRCPSAGRPHERRRQPAPRTTVTSRNPPSRRAATNLSARTGRRRSHHPAPHRPLLRVGEPGLDGTDPARRALSPSVDGRMGDAVAASGDSTVSWNGPRDVAHGAYNRRTIVC